MKNLPANDNNQSDKKKHMQNLKSALPTNTASMIHACNELKFDKTAR